MLRDLAAGGVAVLADLGPLRDSGSAVAQELAELFGVRVTGAPRTGVRNNYMAVTAPEPVPGEIAIARTFLVVRLTGEVSESDVSQPPRPIRAARDRGGLWS